ncbi:hypothetical protein P3X46_012795 [Hevea brasiliensis]|uniref:Uncharacterized protein n=1 Tax=Hevea brasiliensis TaxID=3981 RepID=A0ABQ9MEY6_HEVBR|nr:hypothetical protein P3X46_012795 [Hevea brasiliensis]
MASVSLSPPWYSPMPTVANDLSTIEEGKEGANSPEASAQEITVSPINAHMIMVELMGTYVIIFIGCGSILIDQKHGISLVGVSMAWGLVVMVMIYALGHVSGGHFNLAITIAFAVPGYVISQLAGSILAILTLSSMFHGKQDIKFTVTQYSGQATDLEGFIWDRINELSGVAVIINSLAAMLFDMLIAGKITGASMNPARSIGAAFVSDKFECLWVYIVAPNLGMITASKMYSLLWIPPSENLDKENAKIA